MRMLSVCRHVAIAFLTLSIPAVAAEPIHLLEGGNLSQWTSFIWDAEAGKEDTTTAMSSIWSIEDDVLICKGEPQGYIKTTKDYENYRLALDWRWQPGTERANSGVIVHMTPEFTYRFWPTCIEVQLSNGSAGDLVSLGTTIEIPNPAGRKRGSIHTKLTDGAEKTPGEWNHLEVLCEGDQIKVWVNGTLVNEAFELSRTSGPIALQSEGTEIHFRNIVVTPLD